MSYERIRKSITDLKPNNLTKKIHEVIDVVNEQERELSLIWDILSGLDIAVCDYCQDEWFFAKPPRTGLSPRGDVRGLLVAGGACCAKCLDRLYEESQYYSEEEQETVYQDIALWLLHHRSHLNQTIWADDSEIKRIMQLHVARS